MNNEFGSAFPVATDRDPDGMVSTYGQPGLTSKQYAEIHLMAGLLSNFEFVSGKTSFEVADAAKQIVDACIQRIT